MGVGEGEGEGEGLPLLKEEDDALEERPEDRVRAPGRVRRSSKKRKMRFRSGQKSVSTSATSTTSLVLKKSLSSGEQGGDLVGGQLSVESE